MPNLANPRNTAYTREEIERAIVAAGDAGDMEAVRELGQMLPQEQPRQAQQAQSPNRTGIARLMLGRDDPRGAMEQLGAGAGDVVQGVGDILGLAANPVGQLFYDAIGRNENYDTGEILRGATGLPEQTDTTINAVNRGATSALAPAAGARMLVSKVASPIANAALQTVGRTPVRDAVAGAAAGAAIDATQDQGPLVQTGAGLAAGVLGYGTASGIEQALRRSLPNALETAARGGTPIATGPIASQARRTVADDAADLNVRLLPAATGGTATKMATGVSRVTLGEIPIAAAAQKSVDSAARARGAVAQQIGDVARDTEGAGQIVRRGLRDWTEKTGEGEGNRVQQLFDKIPIAADAEMELGTTRQALTELTEGFRSNPKLSRIWVDNKRLRETLEALTPEDVARQGRRDFLRASSEYSDAVDALNLARNGVNSPGTITQAQEAVEAARIAMLRAQRQSERAPVGGQLSWGDASRLRSIIGEIIDQPGLAAEGNATQALRKFYGALSTDMEQTAAKQGPRALSMWRRAVQYKRGREDRIENVITDILGPRNKRSDEAVFNQINRWASKGASGNARSLARTLRSMDREEVNTVRATLLDRMGTATKGRQNADGDVFSPAQFVTEWNGLAPKARAMLFPESQHRGDVQKLVRIMDAMQTSERYANTSKTAIGANVGLGAALIGFDQFLMAGMGTLGSLAVGKVLSSNRLARMLARPPKTNSPAAQAAYFERLRNAATPETLPIIIELEKSTMSAVNDNAANISNAVANDEQN